MKVRYDKRSAILPHFTAGRGGVAHPTLTATVIRALHMLASPIMNQGNHPHFPWKGLQKTPRAGTCYKASMASAFNHNATSDIPFLTNSPRQPPTSVVQHITCLRGFPFQNPLFRSLWFLDDVTCRSQHQESTWRATASYSALPTPLPRSILRQRQHEWNPDPRRTDG